jgi:H+/Cl- antiporter ClcA
MLLLREPFLMLFSLFLFLFFSFLCGVYSVFFVQYFTKEHTTEKKEQKQKIMYTLLELETRERRV